MALALYDRVQETTTTSGTGSVTLAGAVSGYQSFAVVGNGNTCFYTIVDGSAWEVGLGTYSTTGPTLARTTVYSNSNGNTSPITLSSSANTKAVFLTYPAEKSINYDANGVATIGSVLGYSDTGIIGSFASTVAGYNQVIIQNKSNATNASCNFNVSNDVGTSGANFAEFGINSSTFSNGSGCFNIAGAAYVASASTDLSIGTYGAYNIHFATNSGTTDAMTIYNDGGTSLGGYGDPGIGNLAVNKLVPGVTIVTAAGGTTTLNAASTYYQKLVAGSGGQTFKLPDATTLLPGTTFIFDNDSGAVLTIIDNASGAVDTVQSGALDYIWLESNATVAGSWGTYSFLPASYDFSTTTANFGGANITSATYQGNTVQPAYGGTGLTTFSAANNAIYSTSSSALTAGTLPVAAGGTGATTLTGYVYGNGTSAMTASTTIPTSALTGNFVSTFSAGTTGLTPSTATTGAVTLAGTLATGNGGTGLTGFTAANNAIYSTSSSALTAGTLPVAAGGTGLTTAPTNGQIDIGSTGVGFVRTTLTAGTGISITNGAGSITIANSSTPVTSVTGTSPVVSSGGTTPAISLASGYGDTQNPYASKTANYFLAAPNGSAGAPTFRAIVAADIPTLNQNTTGTSGGLTGTPNITVGSISASGNVSNTNNGYGYSHAPSTSTNAAYSQWTNSGGTFYVGIDNSAGTSFGTAYSVNYYYSGNYLHSWWTNSTRRMTLSAAGGLSLNTTADPGVGAIYATGNVTAYYSDARLKTVSGKIESALDKVKTLSGVYYTNNEIAKQYGYTSDEQQVGVLAQEIEAVMPEVVKAAPFDLDENGDSISGENYKTVQYERLVPLLIEAIKELEAQVAELKRGK